MSNGLQPPSAGKPLSASFLQEVSRRVAAMMGANMPAGTVSRLGTNSRAARLQGGWWGVITAAGPASEADYTDARYWVESAVIMNGVGTWSPTVEVDVEASAEAAGTESVQWVTATNLAEMLDDTHNLTAGTPVWVQRMYGPDADSPFYVFALSPPGGDVVAVRAATTSNQSLTGVTAIDGVTLSDGDSVLLQNETTASQTGVYTFDASTGNLTNFRQPKGVLVLQGTANKETLWALSAANTYSQVGGNAKNISETITQANSFIAGYVIYRNGSTYSLAKADAAATAEAVGIVQSASGTQFTVVYAGKITGLSGLSDGGVYFVSDTTAGVLTLTEPNTTDHVSKPILIADSATTGVVVNFRGEVIEPGIQVVFQ